MPRPVRIRGTALVYTPASAYNPPLTLTEPGPPNLDAMTERELRSFWHATYVGGWAVARFLFPDRPKNYVSATRALGNYASNKGTAMACRLRGAIQEATVYEGIADRIYDDLPDYARW